MSFPGARPVEELDRAALEYAIVGAPLDASTTFEPGARFGPRRIRHHAQAFDDYDRRTDRRFTDCAVGDHGDVRPTDDVEEYLTFLTDLLEGYRDDDDVAPLILGGEHTVSVAAMRAVDPDVVVTCDAHLDLYESYAGNPRSHATVSRHALDIADRVVVLGARTGSKAEWDVVDDNADRLDVVPPADVPDWDPDFDDETVHCSVDVDAADPAYAPGTGTPEPFGLTSTELRDVVRRVAPRADAFDVVEVNDRDDGQAATLAAKLLREFVFSHAHASEE